MADLLKLALSVFTFQNNTKIAANVHLLEFFALLLVFPINLQPTVYRYHQSLYKVIRTLRSTYTKLYRYGLWLPPPLLGGGISKSLTLPFALAFQASNIETMVSEDEVNKFY